MKKGYDINIKRLIELTPTRVWLPYWKLVKHADVAKRRLWAPFNRQNVRVFITL